MFWWRASGWSEIWTLKSFAWGPFFGFWKRDFLGYSWGVWLCWVFVWLGQDGACVWPLGNGNRWSCLWVRGVIRFVMFGIVGFCRCVVAYKHFGNTKYVLVFSWNLFICKVGFSGFIFVGFCSVNFNWKSIKRSQNWAENHHEMFAWRQIYIVYVYKSSNSYLYTIEGPRTPYWGDILKLTLISSLSDLAAECEFARLALSIISEIRVRSQQPQGRRLL